jgi:hypothetical protein
MNTDKIFWMWTRAKITGDVGLANFLDLEQVYHFNEA